MRQLDMKLSAPTDVIPVITIDGPTASGKGTVASIIAEQLGYHYLDSGALYRLTALAAERRSISTNMEAELAPIALNLNCRFDGGRVYLDNDDVTDAIRTEKIGQDASKISALPKVREALLDLQLSFRQFPGLVADGRDMGTVVFPDAGVKVFMTASAEARGERRYRQLLAKGQDADLDEIINDLRIRDERDSNRSTAPLTPAADAVYLDTSSMTINQVVGRIQLLRQVNEGVVPARLAEKIQVLAPYLDAEVRLAELMGWKNIRKINTAVLGCPPTGAENSRGEAMVPQWAREWSAAGPLKSQHEIDMAYDGKGKVYVA
jgi:cytidylate kinase